MKAAPRELPPYPSRPGLPPLVPVLAPLVVAAVVLGITFTRYLSNFVPTRPVPPVRFVDVTAQSGVTFVHQAGADREGSPTSLGSGVVVLDYDSDGAPDLFFVNGTPWPWQEESSSQASALYRNDGSGVFTDVTSAAGLAVRIQGMGAAAGDYDNDGWPDLFITGVGENRLFRNKGDGTFEDVTETAGMANDGRTWSAGALWLDADEDGLLDLLVCNYARWPREVDLEVAFKIAGVGRSYGAPAGFVGASPTLYLNQGDGRFVDATEEAGLKNLAPETRLPRAEMTGAATWDANADGRLDLMLFYHASEPTLLLNAGEGRYREWVNPVDRREGAAAGSVAISALPLFRAHEPPPLSEVLRTVEPVLENGLLRLDTKLGFALMDYDLDGRVDVFLGGGRAEQGLNRFDHGRDFGGAPMLNWNRGDTWIAAPFAVDPLPSARLTVRGVATGDFDRDGDADVVLTQHAGTARLLRNDQRANAAWLQVKLVGTQSTRDGFGARVEVHTPRLKLTRIALPPMGFFSQSETSLRFGLGEDTRVRRIVVTWPGGVRQEIVPEGINRVVTVVEPR